MHVDDNVALIVPSFISILQYPWVVRARVDIKQFPWQRLLDTKV
jgi:hypothetical protein